MAKTGKTRVIDRTMAAMPVDTNPALASLPSTRRAILVTLKKWGEGRAEDLAAELGVTTSAMRQHLSGLTGDGLVGYEERKGGPGRPKHVYHLTAGSEVLFPKYHADLTNELLSYVGDDDPELLERIFHRRRDRRAANARARLAGRPLGQQVGELTRILDEDGYLAECVEMDDGTWRIVEHNCAILGVAARYGQACQSELEFIRTVLPGARVDRVSHIVAGQRQCAYAVTPKPARRRAPRGGA